MKKQAMVLSAALSIASLTGSVASCVAAQPPEHKPVYEPASFCYQTLGEITCYSAPQPQLGPIVALPPEPSTTVDVVAPTTAAPKDDAEPVNTAPPPALPAAPGNSGAPPIQIKPDA